MRARTIACGAALIAAACSDGIGPVQPGTFLSVSAGNYFTCGLLTNRTAYCWGSNANNQLGNGATSQRDSLPRPVGGGLTFRSVDAEQDRACAITDAGAAYCWGGTIAVPTRFGESVKFKTITLGYAHACGLTPTGAAYCWGEAYLGRLGRDTAASEVSSPVPVAGGHTFVAIAAGTTHTCAIEVGGAAYCWGQNFYGNLGTGTRDTTSVSHPVPELVVGGQQFAAIDAGNGHTCGLTTLGKIQCWGSGVWGQLGDGTRSLYQTTPVNVSGGETFNALSLGPSHACGLTVGGRLFCWGYDAAGQLGSPAPETCPYGVLGAYALCATTPIAVTSDLTFRAVAAGGYHTCAIASAGGAFCWGSNADGQAGNGTVGGIVGGVRVSDP
jgi:alpha-tubulin suppressor-like RCC1 family protein